MPGTFKLTDRKTEASESRSGSCPLLAPTEARPEPRNATASPETQLHLASRCQADSRSFELGISAEEILDLNL